MSSRIRPLVSIVLPAYNGKGRIDGAIQSVLRQNWSDFELIIVDDGSDDGTASVLEALHDSRIRVITHGANRGLVSALQTGIDAAEGHYIARHDQDDYSLPERLELQIRHLRANPDVVLLGTWARVVYDQSFVAPSLPGSLRHPETDSAIRWAMLFNSPFVHGSVVMVREAYVEAGGYRDDPRYSPPEDYELWSRLAQVGKMANIPVELLRYHTHRDGMSRTMAPVIRDNSQRIALRVLEQLLGRESDELDVAVNRAVNGDWRRIPRGISRHDLHHRLSEYELRFRADVGPLSQVNGAVARRRASRAYLWSVVRRP